MGAKKELKRLTEYLLEHHLDEIGMGDLRYGESTVDVAIRLLQREFLKPAQQDNQTLLRWLYDLLHYPDEIQVAIDSYTGEQSVLLYTTDHSYRISVHNSRLNCYATNLGKKQDYSFTPPPSNEFCKDTLQAIMIAVARHELDVI